MTHPLRALAVALLMLFIASSLHAQSPFLLTEKEKNHLIGGQMQILVDDTKRLSPDSILSGAHDADFVPSTSEVPNYGYRDANFWFKIRIQDASAPQTRWLLQSTRTQIDTISVFFVTKDRVITRSSGDLYPYASREIAHHTFLFGLPKTQELTLYVFCRGTFSKQFPFFLVEQEEFTEASHKKDTFLGGYYGIFLAMVIFNFLMFLGLNSRSYLYYSLFMGFFLLAQMALSGYGYELLFHRWLRFANISNMLFISLTCFFASLFTRRFLLVDELSRSSAWALRVVDVLSISLALVSLAAIWYNPWVLLASKSAAYLGGITALILFPVGIVLYRKGSRPARFYLIAWSALFLGVIVFALKNNGILPQNALTDISMQIGTLLEVFLLSIGLADRIKSAEKERAQAQEQVIHTLKENDRLIRDQNKTLEHKVEERTREIVEKNVEIEQQLEEIAAQRDMLAATMLELERQNDNIKASINYAKRIQKAMLPQEEKIYQTFEEAFIFFRPRDIVSGDFYWYTEVGTKKIFTVADCTGHGVPGAFMSMIGFNLLNEIINVRLITEPHEILNQLHKGVQKSLQQEYTNTKDGMDIALIMIDEGTNEIHFAGAKNPIFHAHKGELIPRKGNNFPIGGSENLDNHSFTNHVFPYAKGDVLYLFTDGYQDQFGGPEGRKFMVKRFRELITDIHPKPLAEQGALLETTLDHWMGQQKQIDDILVVGIRL